MKNDAINFFKGVGLFILSFLAAFILWVILDIVWLLVQVGDHPKDIPGLGLWELITAIPLFFYWRNENKKNKEQEGLKLDARR